MSTIPMLDPAGRHYLAENEAEADQLVPAGYQRVSHPPAAYQPGEGDAVPERAYVPPSDEPTGEQAQVTPQDTDVHAADHAAPDDSAPAKSRRKP